METQFEISNHPNTVGIKRKIQLIGIFPNFVEKTIVCSIVIQHFDQNNKLFDNYIPSINISLNTSNDKFVDTAGNRVESIEEIIIQNGEQKTIKVPPLGAIGEFDFFFNYISSEPKNLGNTLLDAIAFVIQRNDQAGNFNDLSNFNT